MNKENCALKLVDEIILQRNALSDVGKEKHCHSVLVFKGSSCDCSLVFFTFSPNSIRVCSSYDECPIRKDSACLRGTDKRQNPVQVCAA